MFFLAQEIFNFQSSIIEFLFYKKRGNQYIKHFELKFIKKKKFLCKNFNVLVAIKI